MGIIRGGGARLHITHHPMEEWSWGAQDAIDDTVGIVPGCRVAVVIIPDDAARTCVVIARHTGTLAADCQCGTTMETWILWVFSITTSRVVPPASFNLRT